MFHGYKHITTASLSDKIADITVTCVAPSKTFNLAGLYTSAIIAPNKILRKKYEEILDNIHVGGGNIFGGNDSFGGFGRDPFGGSRSYRATSRPRKGSDIKITLKVNKSEIIEKTAPIKKTINLKRKFQDGSAKTDKIKIPVPYDVKNKQVLRISGKGNQGLSGGSAGDLLVEIKLVDDIISIPVSIFLALRGSTLTLKSPSGDTLKGKLPVGTADKSILTFTTKDDKKVKIRVNYKYPKDLTDTQISLLDELLQIENQKK